MMGSPLSRSEVQQVRFLCVLCSKEVDDAKLDRDPVLLRERVTVLCHGETETFGVHTMLEACAEVQCFGGHG